MFFKASFVSWCLLLAFINSCSNDQKKRRSVFFEVSGDSTLVYYQNKLHCPSFTKIKNLKTGNEEFVQSLPMESTLLMKSKTKLQDSNLILNNYEYSHYYGYYEQKKSRYDTLFNYELPFPKGKKYKIIQGYDGNYTHNTNFSRYTIDFNLQIGDTICAARNGIVVKVLDKHNKQGTSEKYIPYGNYIMIYHEDNTFAQYVHLKQHGSLVKVGDSIKAKQPIAISGFTGLTTTPHLHFGVYKTSKNGFESLPIILNAIEGKHYKKNKIAINE